MKKTLALILSALALCALISGCQKPAEDDSYKITLEGNPTTGYMWFCTADPEGIVDVKSDYIEDEHEPDVVGVGGKYVFTVEGLKEGDVTLTFIYARSEAGDDLADTREYVLHSDASGVITEK